MHRENSSNSIPKTRDQRLDFWRGLCLIDMVLVHLVYQGAPFGALAPYLGEYTRFAAGGFIFIAGLSIAAIYLPRLDRPEGVRKTYLSLWQRAFYILLVHYAAEIGLLLLWPLFGAGPFPSVRQELVDIFLLHKGYDLLPFYVVMIAATPVILELIRRRLTWVVALASVAVFAWGRGNGFANAYHVAFDNQQAFYVVFWQLIFVAGLFFGLGLRRYDSLSSRVKQAITLTCCTSLLVLWVMCYGADFGVIADWPLSFWKVPLTLGETLRYLAFILSIITVTDLLWRRLMNQRWMGAVALLGRHSLAVYVMHIWVVQILVQLSPRFDPTPAMSAILYPSLAVGWLLIFARCLEFTSHRKKDRPAVLWRSQWVRVSFMGTLAALMLFSVNSMRNQDFVEEDFASADTSITASDWQELVDDPPFSIEGTGEVEEDPADLDLIPLELPAQLGIVG